MPARKVGLPSDVPPALTEGLAAVRARLEILEKFPSEVTRAAEQAASKARWPELDRTDLELITIDPPGARDLDQALHITRDGEDFCVSYAIADVAAFVSPGDPVDVEAHRRGQTLYGPDHRTPLHPPALSEDAASLLSEQVRPALLWTVRLDHRGQTLEAQVCRAKVRSRSQLTYQEAQAEIDGGSPRESLALLKELGLWREQRERDRGGVSLQIPEQEINTDVPQWALTFRSPLPVEGWNAQVSLLTGMAAAHIMMYGQVGILRTLPPADKGSLRRLRQTAKALHISWPAELDYPEFVRSLNPERADHAAMLNACTTVFRGAGYRAFSGGIPVDAEHAALAVEYAHATAPLRRLVDRYVGEICLALCADEPVPPWVLTALDALPAEMARSEQRAKKFERATFDLVEAFLLQGRVGETFIGTIVEVNEDKTSGSVVIASPAVEAKITGANLPLGQQAPVRLVCANPAEAVVRFELA
ncbi:MAG: 3'-to-5' exoribonuclease RNase R [uncultured Propionibacteriaceae bacterium]|uniref:3'-to-5' exoribonuclease RNase R n=1 Tax=uncultured Propionibacteriaceae bacterium TaxID=257457 RepID=A0A6J4N0L4_9ACTN|nr:MAG: 3'-to-5' exoribonuclease RNase R [uncultured Propionibacteriaceae bacterium]